MKEIDESYLLEQRNNQEAYTLVFYNIPGCQYCEKFKTVVESIQKNFPEIEFVSLTVANMRETSVFAPIAAPTLLLFVGGFRVKEHLGSIGDRYKLIELIKEWVL